MRSAQLRDALLHLHEHLDDDERRALDLRMQGHSTVEVARRLGLDVNVLRVRLFRLRQRLRGAGVLDDWL